MKTQAKPKSDGHAPSSTWEQTLHCLYSHFLFWAVSFVQIYLPVILHQMGYDAKEIGFLLSIFNTVGLICILSFGRLLDIFRCYRILGLGSLALVAFAYTRLFLWSDFAWSVFAIIILAIGFLPLPSLLDSYISGRYQYQPKYYGRIRSFGSFGYIMGLAALSLLGFFSPFDALGLQIWTFALFAFIALLFYASSIYALPIIHSNARESAQQGRQVLADQNAENKDASDDAAAQQTGTQALGWPLIVLLLAIISCWALLMGVNGNFLGIYLRDKFQQQDIGIFFIVATASEIPIIFWGARILYRKPLAWMLLFGFLAALLRLLVYALLPFVWVLLLVQLLHGIAYGLFFISIISIINRYFTRYRSTAIAIYAAIPTLSNGFGAFFGGILIANFGYYGFFWTYFLLVLPIFIPIYWMRKRFFYL